MPLKQDQAQADEAQRVLDERKYQEDLIKYDQDQIEFEQEVKERNLAITKLKKDVETEKIAKAKADALSYNFVILSLPNNPIRN